MTSAKRYTDDNHPERYEFSVKYTESRHYTPITMKRLSRQLHKHLGAEEGFITGIRFRDAEKRDHWFNMDLRDLQRLCEAIDRYLEANPDGGDHMPYDREESAEEIPELNIIEEIPPDEVFDDDDGGELCEPAMVGEVPSDGIVAEVEPIGAAPSEDGSEEQKDDGPHTEFRFCCYAMMDAMLGGSGIMISLDSGELQIGERNLMYCPFCGQSIITHTPPAKVE